MKTEINVEDNLKITTMTHAPETHYEWELTDASDNWQAGGSGNKHSDVYKEAMRYLTQYALDGSHTVTIRKHETTTVLVATSGARAT
jgi:hypothetical protein